MSLHTGGFCRPFPLESGMRLFRTSNGSSPFLSPNSEIATAVFRLDRLCRCSAHRHDRRCVRSAGTPFAHTLHPPSHCHCPFLERICNHQLLLFRTRFRFMVLGSHSLDSIAVIRAASALGGCRVALAFALASWNSYSFTSQIRPIATPAPIRQFPAVYPILSR